METKQGKRAEVPLLYFWEQGIDVSDQLGWYNVTPLTKFHALFGGNDGDA